jgi:hypothetical protein
MALPGSYGPERDKIQRAQAEFRCATLSSEATVPRWAGRYTQVVAAIRLCEDCYNSFTDYKRYTPNKPAFKGSPSLT